MMTKYLKENMWETNQGVRLLYNSATGITQAAIRICGFEQNAHPTYWKLQYNCVYTVSF